MRFSVDGFGVCAVGQSAPRTGIFQLDVLRAGQPLRTVDLSNGATQTDLSLPNGSYVLRLRFVDAATRRDLLPPSDTSITVNSQERI